MTLLDVREGMFTAQIPLNRLSVTSDVTVKVIDSSLELYDTVDATSRRDVKGQRSILNEGRYRGTIDLPNYIDRRPSYRRLIWIGSPGKLRKRSEDECPKQWNVS